MDIYICTDLEGISGIYRKEQVLSSCEQYRQGRALLTREVNIAASACKAAGAGRVCVWDGHGGAPGNILYEEVSPDVDVLIQGQTRRRFPEIESYDAAIFLGYHAMAGTFGAVLEHSYSSTSIQRLEVNGIPAGEILMDAAMMGEAGKPVILVTGDDKCCAEARANIPGVCTAEVKRGLSSFGAALLPPAAAEAVLRKAVAEAVRNAGNMKPVTVSHPVTVRAELIERGQVPMEDVKPYLRRIDGRTYEVSGDTMEEAFWRIW